jgi:tetratricopeptide (TPR) repeat protein
VTLAVVWNVMFARTKAQAYETKAFGLLDALNGADASRQFLQDFAKRMLAAPQNNADGVVLWAHWRFAKASADDAQKSLLPLLDSLNGRLTWINLAADIPDPTTAAQWLDAAATALNTATDPAPAMIAQKFQLAEALKVLADRANMPAALKTSCLKTAATLLEPIPSENGANQTPQTLLAMIYEDQENYAAGAGVYRKMLKSKADDVIALNNLATLLAKMKQPVDGPEALALIAQAIKLQPKVTSFYDTQASVYALLTQDYPKALQSIQQAISLEPANLDWRVSRIWILALSGQRTTATAEFSQLKKDQDLNQLSADSRQKLQDAGLQ